MKILRVMSSGYEEGGVENGVVRLQPVFEALGHEVRTMASDRRMDLPRFADYTYRGISGNSLGKYVRRACNLDAHHVLRRVLADYRPDVVQLHTMHQVSPAVLFALSATPTVATVHGPEEYTPSLIMWYLPSSDFADGSHRREALTPVGRLRLRYMQAITQPLYRRGFRNVDQFVVLSRYMQTLVRADQIDAVVVPNGIELLDDDKGGPPGPVVLYAGRLESFKGVDVLMRAVPQVRRAVPDVRVVIAGDGVHRAALAALSAELGVADCVELTGHLNRDELAQRSRDARVGVMPSIWPEAFGKAGLEIASAGRPVVATDVGGIAEWMIDGHTGYLVEPGDHQALGDRLVTLLTDDERWRAMSRQARRRAEEFSLTRHAERMIEVYEDVIARSNTSPAARPEPITKASPPRAAR